MAIRSEDSDGFWQAFSRQEQDSTNRLLPTTLAAPFILCASSATPCRSASSSNSANRVRSSRLLANKVSSNRCNAAGSPPVMASSERMSKRLSIGDSEPSSFIQTPSICLKEGHCALRCPACGTSGIRRTTRPYMPSGPVIRKQHKGIASASAVQTGSIACCVSSNGPKRPWKRSWPARSLPLPADRSRPDRSFREGNSYGKSVRRGVIGCDRLTVRSEPGGGAIAATGESGLRAGRDETAA